MKWFLVISLYLLLFINGISSLLRIQLKNGLLETKFTAGNVKTSTNIPIANYLYALFHGSVTIGTPPQTMHIFFDTTSADLWVPSPSVNFTCESCSISKYSKYNYTYKSFASSTYKKNGKGVTVDTSAVFGNNTPIGFSDKFKVSGILSSDTVSIAGLTLPNQIFAEITNETDYWLLPGATSAYIQVNGALGLGLSSSSNNVGSTSVFQNLLKSGLFSKKMFAFWFNGKGIDPTKGVYSSIGELTLGGTDPSRYTGNLVWTPVIAGQPYWQITVQYLTIGPTCGGIRLGTGTGYQMIIHTMFPQINGPRKELDRLASLSEGFLVQSYGIQAIYYANCSLLNSLPNITFTIAGVGFELTPQQYLVPGSINSCSGPYDTAQTIFVSLGNPIDSNGNPVWILGSVFLQNFYVAFDYDNNRIGFALPA